MARQDVPNGPLNADVRTPINNNFIDLYDVQLPAKAPINNPTFTGTVSGIDKTMVGLENVDNTSDLDKPVSTAQQTALDLKVDNAVLTGGTAQQILTKNSATDLDFVWSDMSTGEVVVDLPPYNAPGDGSSDDTAAFSLAITEANNTGKTLKLTPGKHYRVQPGALPAISCDFDGWGATIQALDNTDDYILKIIYEEASGSAFRLFRLTNLLGISNYSGVGTGLLVDIADYSKFYIMNVRNFKRGISLDGTLSGKHIGVNDFYVNILGQCTDGVYMSSADSSGAGSKKCESNNFYINYGVNNTNSCVKMVQSPDGVTENKFEFMFLEVIQVNANGLDIEANCIRNTFIISGATSGESGTGKLIVAAGGDNIFRLPRNISDTSRMTITAGQFFETMPVSFRANNSGNDVVLANGDNKIPFDATVINQGSAYNVAADNFFPPVAGTYRLHGQVRLQTTAASQQVICYIKKNGVVVSYGGRFLSDGVGGPLIADVSCELQANGLTDSFEFWIFQDGSAQTLDGDISYTFFEGSLVSLKVADPV